MSGEIPWGDDPARRGEAKHVYIDGECSCPEHEAYRSQPTAQEICCGAHRYTAWRCDEPQPSAQEDEMANLRAENARLAEAAQANFDAQLDLRAKLVAAERALDSHRHVFGCGHTSAPACGNCYQNRIERLAAAERALADEKAIIARQMETWEEMAKGYREREKRLREALREIAEMDTSDMNNPVEAMRQIARAARMEE